VYIKEESIQFETDEEEEEEVCSCGVFWINIFIVFTKIKKKFCKGNG